MFYFRCCVNILLFYAKAITINSPPVGCKVLRWSCLYLSVCLSVHSHISKTTCPDFTKFSVHVMYMSSGFVDYLMFSHNGLYGTWLRVHIVKVSHQGSALGAKSWCLQLPCYYYLRQGGYVIVVVYLSVCLSVSNFVQKLPNRFAWNFQEGWQWANEQMFKFWWRSGSLSGYRDCFSDSSLLVDTESG